MAVTIELNTPTCVMNQVRVWGQVIVTEGELLMGISAKVVDSTSESQSNSPAGATMGFIGANNQFDFNIPSMGTTGEDRVHVWVEVKSYAKTRSAPYNTCSMQPPGP